MAYEDALHRWIKAHPTGSKPAESPAADGGSRPAAAGRRRTVSVHSTKFGTYEVKYRVDGKQRSKSFKNVRLANASARE